MNIYLIGITLPAMERWKKGQFKTTIKELSQELESEFGHFNLDNSYPSSPFKTVTSWTFRFHLRTVMETSMSLESKDSLCKTSGSKGKLACSPAYHSSQL